MRALYRLETTPPDNTGAIEDLLELLSLNVLSGAPLFQIRTTLVKVYITEQKYEKVISLIDTYLPQADDKEKPYYYYFLSIAYTETFQLDKARHFAEQSILLSKTPVRNAYHQLNLIYTKLDLLEERKKLLAAMIDHWPQEPALEVELAAVESRFIG